MAKVTKRRSVQGTFYKAVLKKEGWWITMNRQTARRFPKAALVDTEPFGYYYPKDAQDAVEWVERIVGALDSAFKRGDELVRCSLVSLQ